MRFLFFIAAVMIAVGTSATAFNMPKLLRSIKANKVAAAILIAGSMSPAIASAENIPATPFASITVPPANPELKVMIPLPGAQLRFKCDPTRSVATIE